MNNRRTLTALVGAGHSSLPFPVQATAPLAVIGRLWATARQTLMALGLAAIAALALLFFRPALLDDLKALSPFAQPGATLADTGEVAIGDLLELPPATPAPMLAAAGVPPTREQQRVAQWLAKRYKIAGSASKMLVGAAYESGDALKLDPLLVLAVMAIESRFNPFAESSVGAQGLMQVMSKVHHDKFDDHGGIHAALNPAANIDVGARILKDVIRRGGSVEAGLKLYVGAGNLPHDGGYAARVMAEYARLQTVAAGQRVPATTPRQPSAEVREAKAEPAPRETAPAVPEPA